jgi:hypothetical protein
MTQRGRGCDSPSRGLGYEVDARRRSRYRSTRCPASPIAGGASCVSDGAYRDRTGDPLCVTGIVTKQGGATSCSGAQARPPIPVTFGLHRWPALTGAGGVCHKERHKAGASRRQRMYLGSGPSAALASRKSVPYIKAGTKAGTPQEDLAGNPAPQALWTRLPSLLTARSGSGPPY